MKKPEIGQELLLLLLLILPMAYLGIIWPYMPEVMPTNFNVDGVAERVGNKSDFLLLMTFLFFTNGLLYFLFRYIIFMASQGHPFVVERWVFTGVGMLIGVLGLYLKRLEPNYFIGVRTPWTLQSDDIWRLTHHFAGTLWLCTGIAMIVVGFFLPVVTGVFLLIFAGAILAALPYIYSFRLFHTDKG